MGAAPACAVLGQGLDRHRQGARQEQGWMTQQQSCKKFSNGEVPHTDGPFPCRFEAGACGHGWPAGGAGQHPCG